MDTETQLLPRTGGAVNITDASDFQLFVKETIREAHCHVGTGVAGSSLLELKICVYCDVHAAVTNDDDDDDDDDDDSDATDDPQLIRASELAMLLFYHSRITVLELEGIRIKGNSDIIYEALARLQNLEEFHALDCMMFDSTEDEIHLFHALSCQHGLRELTFSAAGNRNARFLGHMVEMLQKCPLQHIEVADSSFEEVAEEGLSQILQVCQRSLTLKYLGLFLGPLNSDHIVLVGRFLEQNVSLQTLELSVSGSTQLLPIIEALKTNEVLKRLKIQQRKNKLWYRRIVGPPSRIVDHDRFELQECARVLETKNVVLEHIMVSHWHNDKDEDYRRMQFYLELNRRGRRPLPSNMDRLRAHTTSAIHWMMTSIVHCMLFIIHHMMAIIFQCMLGIIFYIAAINFFIILLDLKDWILASNAGKFIYGFSEDL